jgi:hypothetical protein
VRSDSSTVSTRRTVRAGGAYTTVQSNDAAVQELGLEVSGFSAESEWAASDNLVPRDGGNLFRVILRQLHELSFRPTT